MDDPRYIEIVDWGKFQHYKHRNPPWIKLYSYLLDNDEFDCMQDASKMLYFCLLLFASRRENKIKLDFKWLQKKLPIENPITQATIQPLIDNGFITCKHLASKPIAERLQNASPEKSRVEESREETEAFSFFKDAHNNYPGTKRECSTELDDFQKLPFYSESLLPLLLDGVSKQIEHRANADFKPAWKSFKNWLAGRHWEDATTDPEIAGKDCIVCHAPYAEGHKFNLNKRTQVKEYKCPTCREMKLEAHL